MYTTVQNIHHYTLNFTQGTELAKFRNFIRHRKNIISYRNSRGNYTVHVMSDSAEHLMFAMLFSQRQHSKTSQIRSTSYDH